MLLGHAMECMDCHGMYWGGGGGGGGGGGCSFFGVCQHALSKLGRKGQKSAHSAHSVAPAGCGVRLHVMDYVHYYKHSIGVTNGG